MKIGPVICALRKERKLTQEDVALSAGIDAATQRAAAAEKRSTAICVLSPP